MLVKIEWKSRKWPLGTLPNLITTEITTSRSQLIEFRLKSSSRIFSRRLTRWIKYKRAIFEKISNLLPFNTISLTISSPNHVALVMDHRPAVSKSSTFRAYRRRSREKRSINLRSKDNWTTQLIDSPLNRSVVRATQQRWTCRFKCYRHADSRVLNSARSRSLNWRSNKNFRRICNARSNERRVMTCITRRFSCPQWWSLQFKRWMVQTKFSRESQSMAKCIKSHPEVTKVRHQLNFKILSAPDASILKSKDVIHKIW